MAEQPKITRHRVRNTAQGVRGFYDAELRYHELAPGQTVEGVPMTAIARAPLGAHFAFDGDADTAAEDTDASDADGLPESKADLEKLAAAEGIDLATIKGSGKNGNVVKADIAAAIQAKREAAQAPAGGIPPSNPGPNDDLDNMSDADLRDAVKVLTGEDAPADADRAALLALARGEATE